MSINVKFVSPSFLVKKADSGFRFVTVLNNVSQYIFLTPTVAMSCGDILRHLSTFKYVIKTNFTKLLPNSIGKKLSSIFSNRSTIQGSASFFTFSHGMPGSSEFLKELTSRAFGDLSLETF